MDVSTIYFDAEADTPAFVAVKSGTEDEESAHGYFGLEYRPIGEGARRLAKR